MKFELQFLSEKKFQILFLNIKRIILFLDHNINNIDNQLIINQSCEIQKIIEKINLAFLKEINEQLIN